MDQSYTSPTNLSRSPSQSTPSLFGKLPKISSARRNEPLPGNPTSPLISIHKQLNLLDAFFSEVPSAK